MDNFCLAVGILRSNATDCLSGDTEDICEVIWRAYPTKHAAGVSSSGILVTAGLFSVSHCYQRGEKRRGRIGDMVVFSFLVEDERCSKKSSKMGYEPLI